MKFKMSGEHYKKFYVIKILNTNDRTKWYYTKTGRIYECEIEYIKKKPFFRIDYLHKIPVEFANIIETKTIILYKKL